MPKKLKLKIETNPLDRIEAQLGDLSKALEQRNKFIARACIAIQPTVRTWLLSNLRASTVHKGTGELERLVAQAIVYPTAKGLRIGPPRHLSQDKYKKMASVQNGFLRGSSIKSSSIKKAIKKNIKKTGITPAGLTLVKGHPYFNLNPDQQQQFGKLFNTLFTVEVNKYINRKGA